MSVPVVSPRFAAWLLKASALVCLACLMFAPCASAGTIKILFSPKPGEGAHAWGTPVLDSAGHLYGTFQEGGGECDYFGAGCGSVFEIALQPNGTWKPLILHRFSGTDGYLIYAG